MINATGVVVHTNLGRAPLSFEALEAIDRGASGYSQPRVRPRDGERGSRQAHVEELLPELTGAEAAMAVNNNAAGVLLALAALAGGREVVDLARRAGRDRRLVPDPRHPGASGARLVEVGTTNRTRSPTTRRAVGPETAALMRVHASNFRTVGFTEEASLTELCELGRARAWR